MINISTEKGEKKDTMLCEKDESKIWIKIL